MPHFKDGQFPTMANLVMTQTEEEGRCLVGQAFTSLRADNPQKDPQTRQLDSQLAQQQADYKKMDVPSRCELPIPNNKKKQVHQLDMMRCMAKDKAILDHIWMAIYCWTNADGHPFTLDYPTFCSK
jgi:hypothetical protein